MPNKTTVSPGADHGLSERVGTDFNASIPVRDRAGLLLVRGERVGDLDTEAVRLRHPLLSSSPHPPWLRRYVPTSRSALLVRPVNVPERLLELLNHVCRASRKAFLSMHTGRDRLERTSDHLRGHLTSYSAEHLSNEVPTPGKANSPLRRPCSLPSLGPINPPVLFSTVSIPLPSFPDYSCRARTLRPPDPRVRRK